MDFISRRGPGLINLLSELSITMLIPTKVMELEIASILRTIVMDEGRVVADGLTIEILDDEKPLTAYGLENPQQLQHVMKKSHEIKISRLFYV